MKGPSFKNTLTTDASNKNDNETMRKEKELDKYKDRSFEKRKQMKCFACSFRSHFRAQCPFKDCKSE